MTTVKEVYAYVAQSGPDEEVVVRDSVGDSSVPLMAANYSDAEAMRPAAIRLAHTTKSKIRLVRFNSPELVEEIP